jgi:hypothetical protein
LDCCVVRILPRQYSTSVATVTTGATDCGPAMKPTSGTRIIAPPPVVEMMQAMKPEIARSR